MYLNKKIILILVALAVLVLATVGFMQLKDSGGTYYSTSEKQESLEDLNAEMDELESYLERDIDDVIDELESFDL